MAFINSGSIRAYHKDDNLIEANLLLRASGEFINDYESFISQEKSKLYIECIEDGEAIFLNREGLYKLYDTSFYWNKFGRMAVEQVYINSKQRAEELLVLSPEERYLLLMNRQPDFFNKFPLKHIASYMGITPQSLSRIRNRISGA